MLQRNCFYFDDNQDFDFALNASMELLKLKVMHSSLIGFTVYVDAHSEDDFASKLACVAQVANMHFPKVLHNAVSQPSAYPVLIEYWELKDAKQIHFHSLDAFSYVTFEDNFGDNLFFLGLNSSQGTDIKRQYESTFEWLLKILKMESFSLDHVLRQWNYIAGILDFSMVEGQLQQHYQLFNDVRERYYHAYKLKDDYPAATGIGQLFGGLRIDILATKPKDDVCIASVTNPLQIDAFKYSKDQLIGSSISKKPPLFARAKALVLDSKAVLFLSGTASIIGEQTYGVGDLKLQVETTLNNMRQLIAPSSLSPVNWPSKQNASFCLHKVYLKSKSDFVFMKSMCDLFFRDEPYFIVFADVCRDDLLVEVESDFCSPA